MGEAMNQAGVPATPGTGVVGTSSVPHNSPSNLDSGTSSMGQITPRSIIVGLIACALVSIWCPQSAWVLHSSRLNLSQLPVAAFGLFFTFILVNIGIGRISRRVMFRPAEILVVFVMSFIAATMATADLLDWVFSVMAVPYYLATPENRWMDDLWPHLKQWAVVQGPSEELRWAFVGMPHGESIPWNLWLIPTFWWGSFIGAVAFSSICLAALLRKQWADHERLAFPLAQVPLYFMSNPGGRWSLPEMMRTRGFWIGVSFPLFVILFNSISYFSPSFPQIPIGKAFDLRVAEGFVDTTPIRVNLYVVGFAYMVNTNILFSVWFWYVLVLLQRVMLDAVGYTVGPAGDGYGARDAMTSWQGFGALIVLVFWGLWMARRHLRDVVLSVLGRKHMDDTHELLPYRWAFVGLLASTAYMGMYLLHLGMSPTMIGVFLFAAFVAYLGTTRVIAQTGLVYMQSPLTPVMFAFSAFGTVGIPPSQIVGMVGTYSLVVNGRAPLMPGIFHMSWLGAKIGRSGRRMFVAMTIGLTASFVVGAAYMIYISYLHGATTFGGVPFTKHGSQIYTYIIKKMQARTAIDPERWLFLGIGGFVMVVLAALQYRFPAWPLHPIGFPIAATNNVRKMVFAIFLAWAIKSLLLHLGGVERYEKTKPFFMGIIGGYALGVALSFVIDFIFFPGTGHQIHNW